MLGLGYFIMPINQASRFLLFIYVYIFSKRYCFIRFFVFVSQSPLSGRCLFFCFLSNPVFYVEIPAFSANIPCYPRFYARYHAWCTGVTCVARSRLQTCTWCYLLVQFNLLARSPIPGPSPDLVPAGDWRAELRISSVSRTSKRRLQCV